MAFACTRLFRWQPLTSSCAMLASASVGNHQHGVSGLDFVLQLYPFALHNFKIGLDPTDSGQSRCPLHWLPLSPPLGVSFVLSPTGVTNSNQRSRWKMDNCFVLCILKVLEKNTAIFWLKKCQKIENFVTKIKSEWFKIRNFSESTLFPKRSQKLNAFSFFSSPLHASPSHLKTYLFPWNLYILTKK